MGAWSLGPFDSDGALDFLGYVAEETSKRDDEHEIVPGSVDHEAAYKIFEQRLRAVVDGADHQHDLGDAYTAAGLIAAVLFDDHPGLNSGTRLGDLLASALGVERPSSPIEQLGLSAHCGYAALLTREQAEQLRRLARQAATTLAESSVWLSTWLEQDAAREYAWTLAAILAA